MYDIYQASRAITGYFEVSVSFNQENRREKFIILISILYPIYSMLISIENLLCFLRELLMVFLNIHIYIYIFKMHYLPNG